jgi:hypothetical protein
MERRSADSFSRGARASGEREILAHCVQAPESSRWHLDEGGVLQWGAGKSGQFQQNE